MMTPENFVYWLNGFIEMSKPETLNEEQMKMLKEHLALVLEKKTGEHDRVLPVTWTVTPGIETALSC